MTTTSCNITAISEPRSGVRGRRPLPQVSERDFSGDDGHVAERITYSQLKSGYDTGVGRDRR
jgi:hypothetical protein